MQKRSYTVNFGSAVTAFPKEAAKKISRGEASLTEIRVLTAFLMGNGSSVSTSKLCTQTGLDESDVISALAYWRGVGVLSYEDGSAEEQTASIEEKQTKKLLEMGVLAQVNAVSLCNIFTRRRILNYIRTGQAMFLGSDVHDEKAPQYDFYEKALKIIGEEDVSILMQNAAEVLGLIKREKKSTDSSGLILF